ncbi:MAG: hypothetical protein BJ554DRAFT_2091 [Olpidium bornovanus]|uniref:non-specific serine/threonine protein kinase n=1 Tax=Olpidium bornovanus TaxID=278681 RepID=A0A8H8DGP6_9FUNG|nr:MAG: hypothetical protein BJ554DRAFT_2091 [Olpidium bornovanus]
MISAGPPPRTCKSCIRKLLNKDEHRRLGSKAGAADVKAHPFFKGVKWALLRHLQPPIVPRIAHEGDTSNFRNLRESRSLNLEDEKSVVHGEMPEIATANATGRRRTKDTDEDPFKNFSSRWCHI